MGDRDYLAIQVWIKMPGNDLSWIYREKHGAHHHSDQAWIEGLGEYNKQQAVV